PFAPDRTDLSVLFSELIPSRCGMLWRSVTSMYEPALPSCVLARSPIVHNRRTILFVLCRPVRATGWTRGLRAIGRVSRASGLRGTPSDYPPTHRVSEYPSRSSARRGLRGLPVG